MNQDTDEEARVDLLQWTAERAAERVARGDEDKRNPYPPGSSEFAEWDRCFEEALQQKKYGLD